MFRIILKEIKKEMEKQEIPFTEEMLDKNTIYYIRKAEEVWDKTEQHLSIEEFVTSIYE
jgi:hypothetical protein